MRETFAATRRCAYFEEFALDEFPSSGPDEVDVYFFNPGILRGPEVLEAYGFWDLRPDPYAQCAINEVDTSFAGTCPNRSQWGSPANILTFHETAGGKRLYAGSAEPTWTRSWWLCGVPLEMSS